MYHIGLGITNTVYAGTTRKLKNGCEMWIKKDDVTKEFLGVMVQYLKDKEEMPKQDYSLFDFVMQYENGKFKCKYKSGKVFESVDGEIWKENYNSKRERIKVEK